MASQEGFALKTIELGRCMICGYEKEEHHNYEPEIMLAPDNCVCFDDEGWEVFNN
jgi:DNA-binding XRE family transcriptional regulator